LAAKGRPIFLRAVRQGQPRRLGRRYFQGIKLVRIADPTAKDGFRFSVKSKAKLEENAARRDRKQNQSSRSFGLRCPGETPVPPDAGSFTRQPALEPPTGNRKPSLRGRKFFCNFLLTKIVDRSNMALDKTEREKGGGKKSVKRAI
jgi:hypothetical protein